MTDLSNCLTRSFMLKDQALQGRARSLVTSASRNKVKRLPLWKSEPQMHP